MWGMTYLLVDHERQLSDEVGCVQKPMIERDAWRSCIDLCADLHWKNQVFYQEYFEGVLNSDIIQVFVSTCDSAVERTF